MTQYYAQQQSTIMPATEYWDLAHAKFPRTLKALFRLLRVTYHTSSDIGALVNVKSSYVITDITYKSLSAGSEVTKTASERWKTLMEKQLRIFETEKSMLVDYEVFGNAFVMLVVPWLRHYSCSNCQESFTDKTLMDKPLKIMTHEYFSGTCPRCKRSGKFTYVDKIVRSAAGLKLVRLAPEDMRIEYNPLTDERDYLYTVPKHFSHQVRDGANAFLVKTTPRIFLEAIYKDKPVLLNKNMMYHMINSGAAQRNAAWGFPPLAHALRDVWLQQTIKKAQEAVAKDHILPMTLLSPSQSPGVPPPASSIDLGALRGRIEEMINQWRTDPNKIFIAPVPLNVENIRGDAAALSVSNDISLLRQSIAAVMGLPSEVLYGSVSWSGANVSLRISENQLLRQHAQLERFLAEFLVPKIRAIAEMPGIEISHVPFKMADDVQMKSLMMDLYNAGLISAQSALTVLGYDYNAEQKRIELELNDKLGMQGRMHAAEATSAGDGMVIQARYQVLAQMAAQEQMQLSNPAPPPQPPIQLQDGTIVDPATGNVLDPNTGQPTGQVIDPNTGQIMGQGQDPNAQDPNAQDPNAQYGGNGNGQKTAGAPPPNLPGSLKPLPVVLHPHLARSQASLHNRLYGPWSKARGIVRPPGNKQVAAALSSVVVPKSTDMRQLPDQKPPRRGPDNTTT